MASNGVLARLRFVGTEKRLRGLTARPGHVYRVIMLGGCGSFKVRVYDPGCPRYFADCHYSNLAEFVSEWEVIGNEC